jgi:hypothetical protein
MAANSWCTTSPAAERDQAAVSLLEKAIPRDIPPRVTVAGNRLGGFAAFPCTKAAVTHNPQNRLHNPVTPPYKLGPNAALRQVSRDRK